MAIAIVVIEPTLARNEDGDDADVLTLLSPSRDVSRPFPLPIASPRRGDVPHPAFTGARWDTWCGMTGGCASDRVGSFT